MFGDFLFDENGNAWPTQSYDWRSRLGLGDTFGSLSDYAVKNLGYVRIVSQPNRAVVSFRPSVVTGPTVAGLFYHLADFRFRSIAVRMFDDSTNAWSYRVLSSNETPIHQIIALLDSARPVVARSSFLSRKVSFGTVANRSPLHDSIAYFRDTGGRLKVNQISNFSTIFTRRHMLYKIDEQAGTVTLVSIGGCFPTNIQNVLYSAIGNDMRDRPDPVYGAECAKAYLHVAGTGEPGCFEVDAMSKWRVSDQLVRRRYRRVIFPLRDESGQKWALGQSTVDNSIDLRALAV